MPEAAAALRRDERTVREAALVAAALAGLGFLAVQAAEAAQAPGGLAGMSALAWARLAIPTLAAAATGAALGRRPPWPGNLRRPAAAPAAGLARGLRPHAHPGAEPPSAASPSAASLARRLAALPDKAGRPLALRRAETAP